MHDFYLAYKFIFLLSMANMSFMVILFLFYEFVDSAPTKVEINDDNNNVSDNNEVNGEPRAGIIDTINPFNKESGAASPDMSNQNNPLAPLQNVFNISNNPFQQLFSSTSGNSNFLNDVKIFMIGSGGMVFPASALFGGFQNFIQAMGNIGNFMQTAQNVIPPLSGN